MRNRTTVAELCQQIVDAIRFVGDSHKQRARDLLGLAREMLRYLKETNPEHRPTSMAIAKELRV